MSTPLVSVVMPAYNAAATVQEAVRSVLDQGCRELEIIVCDDGSRDATLERLAALQDPRLRVLRNEHNLGPGRTRDRAIAEARGRWIAVIDADDAWRPGRLERLLAAAGGRDDVVVFDDLMICHDAGGRLAPWRPLHGPRAFGIPAGGAADIRLEDYITSPRLLIKPLFPARYARELGVRHSERSFGEDAEFFIRLGAAGASFRYLPEALYLYRVTAGSVTAAVKDVTLMRQCIEACARMDGWSASVQAAFRSKIAALQANEALYALRDGLRQRDALAVLRLLLSRPEVLRILPVRLFRYLQYHIHRVARGGDSR